MIVGYTALIHLCAILLRFCQYCYALSTDIQETYLHVKLDSQERDFTRFFWLSDPANPERITYRFKAVLFDSVSSLFMLSGTLQYHLNSYNSSLFHDIRDINMLITSYQAANQRELFHVITPSQEAL